MQRRYVHGAGVDDPQVWYEGASTADRRWLLADERGSVVAVTDGAGAVLAVNATDTIMNVEKLERLLKKFWNIIDGPRLLLRASSDGNGLPSGRPVT